MLLHLEVESRMTDTSHPPHWAYSTSTITPDHVCTLSETENCDLDNYDMGDVIQVRREDLYCWKFCILTRNNCNRHIVHVLGVHGWRDSLHRVSQPLQLRSPKGSVFSSTLLLPRRWGLLVRKWSFVYSVAEQHHLNSLYDRILFVATMLLWIDSTGTRPPISRAIAPPPPRCRM